MKCLLVLCLLLNFSTLSWASTETNIPLEHANINLKDNASLQRGAKLYINFCLGCHSLSYLRYNRMAQDIGIVDADGNVAKELLQSNLIFSGAKISDPILSAMPAHWSEKWFGVTPPDLTLVVGVRGADWVYTYLRSFYADDTRPMGVNNLVFPDVAMPNVLANLQGIQVPIYEDQIGLVNGSLGHIKVITGLALQKPGSMSEAQFNSAVNDIVNFLAYAAAPETRQRHIIGYWVLGFLILFSIVAYLLKREFWKDVKK